MTLNDDEEHVQVQAGDQPDEDEEFGLVLGVSAQNKKEEIKELLKGIAEEMGYSTEDAERKTEEPEPPRDVVANAASYPTLFAFYPFLQSKTTGAIQISVVEYFTPQARHCHSNERASSTK